MNNLWEFGWDSIGAIFGILAFLVAVIGEWEKLSKLTPKFILFMFFFVIMGIAGFLLSQTSIIWRVASIIIGIFYGFLLGVISFATDENAPQGKVASKFSRAIFAGVGGVALGLWIANLINQ